MAPGSPARYTSPFLDVDAHGYPGALARPTRRAARA